MPPLPESRPVRNRLLHALVPEDLALLRPHLEPLPARRGDVLIRSGEPFRYAYFPEGGLCSVLSHPGGGRQLEMGAFGYDGIVSPALVLGADSTPHEVVIQVGGPLLRIEADALRQAMRRSPALHGVLLRFVQAFVLAVSQTALSNGLSKTEDRLARWLLTAHDRLDGDELPLTHEFLSIMLGVHRPGVTVALHALEEARMIRARRGAITVLDRGKLQEAAGESYGVAEAEYERLIGPFRLHGGEGGNGDQCAA